VVVKLIDQLRPEQDEHNNLNCSFILEDMLSIKEFLSVVMNKENIVRISELACAPVNEENRSSKNCCL
jgi:hypothetical protein